MATEKTVSKSDNADSSEQFNPNSLPVHLTPEEIKVNKAQNVRKFKTDLEVEAGEIKSLAESLLSEGQLQPCLVREEKGKGGVIEYSLIAGHRRRAAGELINTGAFKSQYDPKKEGPYTLECKVVEKDDAQAFKAAIAENLKRKDFSLMDLCLLIADVRKMNGWEGKEGAKHVAAYLGVSQATVTQTEKYEALPKAEKIRLHNGEITGEAALLLLNPKQIDQSKTAVVSERAVELAKKDADKATASKTANRAKHGKKEAAKVKPTKPVVKEKHVKEAARENKALKRTEARTRKDILEFFESMNGPASHPLQAAFADYMVNTFAKGEGTEGKLTAKWDAIGEALPAVKGEKGVKDSKEKKAA